MRIILHYPKIVNTQQDKTPTWPNIRPVVVMPDNRVVTAIPTTTHKPTRVAPLRCRLYNQLN
jgi:hypothetical protein